MFGMQLIVDVFVINHLFSVQETQNGVMRDAVVSVVRELNVRKGSVGTMTIVNVFNQS